MMAAFQRTMDTVNQMIAAQMKLSPIYNAHLGLPQVSTLR